MRMRHPGWLLALVGCSSSVTPMAVDASTDAGDAPVATAEYRLGGTYDVNLRWTAGTGACASVTEAETDEVIVTATQVILRRGNDNFPAPCALYLQREGTDVDAGMGGLQVHATGSVGTCTFHFGAPSDASMPNVSIQLMTADVVFRRLADGSGTATLNFTWAIPMGQAVCNNNGAGGTLVETTDVGS